MKPHAATTLLASAWLVGQGLAAFHRRQFDELPGFDWSTIKPSEDLEWHACLEGLRCARLLVPLDWTKHSSTKGLDDDETIALAVLKLPANVSQSDPKYGGTIMWQPGGPGASATMWVQSGGRELQRLLSEDRQFDVIGFDVRGVGQTTPPIGCFKNSLFAMFAESRFEGMSPKESSSQALRYHLEHFKGFWDLCLEAATKSPVFEYSTTAFVARDMLQLVDKVEASMPRRQGAAASGSKTKPKAMLNYYGSSYGTYIGTTFASLYPDRVALMVLSSVVNTDGYHSGDWISMVDDMEDSIDAWWEQCFLAKDACALWQASDSSPADIKARVGDFIQDLEMAPRFTGVGYGGQIQAFTSVSIRSILSQLAYMDPQYPRTLSNLDVIDSIMRSEVLEELVFDSDWIEESVCSGTGAEPDQVPYRMFDAQKVIRCIDSYKPGGYNVTWAEKILDAHLEQSPTAGAVTAQWPLDCYGFPFKPKWVFKGPFGSPAPDTTSNTTIVAPILMLNNRVDPVTPLSAAYRLSSKHKGSAVVVQNATGHSVERDDGPCVLDIMRAYFTTGAMPENGTVCGLEPIDDDAEGPEVDDFPHTMGSISRMLWPSRVLKQED